MPAALSAASTTAVRILLTPAKRAVIVEIPSLAFLAIPPSRKSRVMMSIATPNPKIHLVESEAAVANSIQATLGDSHSALFDVEWVRHLSDALARLRDKGIAAVLLNLFLPDSQGMETFDKLHGLASDIPILVLVATMTKRWQSRP